MNNVKKAVTFTKFKCIKPFSCGDEFGIFKGDIAIISNQETIEEGGDLEFEVIQGFYSGLTVGLPFKMAIEIFENIGKIQINE